MRNRLCFGSMHLQLVHRKVAIEALQRQSRAVVAGGLLGITTIVIILLCGWSEELAAAWPDPI